jgi:AcrR family transcriptional regulator
MDEHGVDWVSMRRLGDTLGVSATALYWHIGSKEGLWSAALERVMSRVVVEDDPARPWQDRVRTFLIEVRRQLLAHPSALELSLRVGPPVVGRWRGLTHDVMVAAGFTGEDAVDYARIVTWQAIGYVRMEHNAEHVAYVRKVSDDETGRTVHVPATSADDEQGSKAAGYDPAEQYERMVEIFIAGLEAVAVATRRTAASDPPARAIAREGAVVAVNDLVTTRAEAGAASLATQGHRAIAHPSASPTR